MIRFLCNGSPIFKIDGEVFKAKNGFNEMPEKFTKDPYYEICKASGMIKDFVGTSDKQQEDFQKQIQVERERADSLQKELDELKSGAAKDDKKK